MGAVLGDVCGREAGSGRILRCIISYTPLLFSHGAGDFRMSFEKLIEKPLEVRKVCNCDWSKRIQRYWSRLGCGKCYVLIGKTKGYVLLIPVIRDNETIYGLMFCKKRRFCEIRNILWHEAGHVKGQKSSDPVMKEFYADKWAIEEALKKGYTLIVSEILLRCMVVSDTKSSKSHREAANMILEHFKDIGRKILENKTKN